MSLFNDIEKRPDFSTMNKIPAIKEVAQQVNDWCNDETPAEDIERDLSEIYEYRVYIDGFEAAKTLSDSYYYEADSELVDILEHASSKFRNHLRNEIKEWVAQNHIKPKYKVGDKVTVSAKTLRSDKDMKGEVINVYADTAEYTICIPELGHTKGDGVGIKGRVLKFEDLHDLKTEEVKV